MEYEEGDSVVAKATCVRERPYLVQRLRIDLSMVLGQDWQRIILLWRFLGGGGVSAPLREISVFRVLHLVAGPVTVSSDRACQVATPIFRISGHRSYRLGAGANQRGGIWISTQRGEYSSHIVH